MSFISFRFVRFILLALTLTAFICLAGCGNKSEDTEITPFSQQTDVLSTLQTTQTQETSSSYSTDNDVDAYVVFADAKTTVNGSGAAFADNVLTITEPGTYRLTGVLSDGKIYVNSSQEDKKVKLLLAGVTVSCSTDAPLYIENSPDETVLILEEGSVNTFSDTSREIPADTEDYATAVIYSKDDLQIEGAGALNINGSFGKGIFSKNDIDIHSGTISINAVDDGIRGKDSVEILAGTLNISCGGDGIRTSEETEEDKGNIEINGGTINITSELDGIQATGNLVISNGTVSIKAAGGATGEQYNSSASPFGDFSGMWQPDSSAYSSDGASASTKGIKAEKSITINGGILRADCPDDSIHAPVVNINGGDIKVQSDDDGLHADNLATITAGQLVIAKSYEGVEGREISISGGKLIINASDDGFNAASSDSSGTEASGMTGFNLLNFRGNPGGMMGYDSTCNITITGGFILILAQGDGVDSNGNVTMSDGKLIVYGPTSSGNGALDYGGSFNMYGGTLLAVGSSGMAQSVTGNGVEVLNFNADGNANTVYAIADSSNECVIAFAAQKDFSSVVFAGGGITSENSYSFYQGGSVTGFSEKLYGICFDGVYVPGVNLGSIY